MKKVVSLIWVLLLAIILLPQSNSVTGCASCSELQWGYSDGEFIRYNAEDLNQTLEGILYDPSGLPISPELIDRLTNEVEKCLTAISPTGNFPDDMKSGSLCFQSSFQLPIARKSFVVKIANDWVISCDGTQQLLPDPVKAGPAGCVNKGQTPDAQCPCRWRAGVRCPNVLVVTPSFYLYKDVLIRLVTGCQNPWGNDVLAQCASPSTTPLSDGTDPNNGL